MRQRISETSVVMHRHVCLLRADCHPFPAVEVEPCHRRASWRHFVIVEFIHIEESPVFGNEIVPEFHRDRTWTGESMAVMPSRHQVKCCHFLPCKIVEFFSDGVVCRSCDVVVTETSRFFPVHGFIYQPFRILDISLHLAGQVSHDISRTLPEREYEAFVMVSNLHVSDGECRHVNDVVASSELDACLQPVRKIFRVHCVAFPCNVKKYRVPKQVKVHGNMMPMQVRQMLMSQRCFNQAVTSLLVEPHDYAVSSAVVGEVPYSFTVSDVLDSEEVAEF